MKDSSWTYVCLVDLAISHALFLIYWIFSKVNTAEKKKNGFLLGIEKGKKDSCERLPDCFRLICTLNMRDELMIQLDNN